MFIGSKRKSLIGVLFFSLLLISITALAQVDCNLDPFCEDPDAPLPLDTDVVLLLISSTLLSCFMILKKKQYLNRI